MADKEINNQYDFYKNVAITDLGELKVKNSTDIGSGSPSLSAFDFYKRVAIDENNNIKISFQ